MSARRKNGRPGSVRIVGGTWRGRRIPIAAGADLRPTPDRVRETVFNWLRDRVAGARCLDLFAGTGVLGLEALSRGAAEAWLVERDPALADGLVAMVARLAANAHVVRDDARRFLARAPAAAFDLVFVDPPYREPVEPLLDALGPALRPGALVYVERPLEPGLPVPPGGGWLKRGRAGHVEFGLWSLAAAS
ncbi:MAG TPA: 16S rRNA (guanine(966)-N(2))-methyltransferase RsmD [Gammaproteobacteria bacterium]